MSIIVSGQHVKLRQRVEPESDSTQSDRPQFHEFGALTQEQTAHLISHLVKWMSADSDTAQGASLNDGESSPDLALTVEDSAMVIFVSTWQVNVRRELEPECDSSGALHPRYYEYGALNEIQTAALLFHLFEWKGSPPNLDESHIREDLARQGFNLRAHYDSHGCFYDY